MPKGFAQLKHFRRILHHSKTYTPRAGRVDLGARSARERAAIFDQREKIALLIGGNVHTASKALGFAPPQVNWPDYNGYQVVTKPVREFTDSSGDAKLKKYECRVGG
jgi:hypothetical protein